MGLKKAPAIFQRIMEQVLKDLPFADPYIDDFIIGSTEATVKKTTENHFQDLKKSFGNFGKSRHCGFHEENATFYERS